MSLRLERGNRCLRELSSRRLTCGHRQGSVVELEIRLPLVSLADRALLIVYGPAAGTFVGEQDQGRLDTIAGGALWETPPAADDAYPVGSGAVGSFCHRPNWLPWGSLQVANQPMPGTGPGSFASPPSSVTRAASALMSST